MAARPDPGPARHAWPVLECRCVSHGLGCRARGRHGFRAAAALNRATATRGAAEGGAVDDASRVAPLTQANCGAQNQISRARRTARRGAPGPGPAIPEAPM